VQLVHGAETTVVSCVLSVIHTAWPLGIEQSMIRTETLSDLTQQFWKLGDIGRDPPRFIAQGPGIE
jgi:hypothetical protein